MNKKGKIKWWGHAIWVVAVLVVLTLSAYSQNGIGGAIKNALFGQNANTQTNTNYISTGTGITTLTQPQADAALTQKRLECNDGNTQNTAVKFYLTNLLNKSATGAGVQTFDTGMYCYNSDPSMATLSFSGTIVSNMQGASNNFECGKDFLCKPLSVNANPGNTSKFTSIVRSSDTTAKTTPEGWLWFHAKGVGATIEVGGKQLGRFQAKAYSGNNGLPLYNAGSATYDNWVASGGNFTSTTNNGTETSITSSDTFGVCTQLESTLEYTDPTDQGVYAGWKLNTSLWEVPTAKLGGIIGSILPNIKGSLPGPEASAYGSTTTGYDYVYLMNGPMDQDNIQIICLTTKPKSGMNPVGGGPDDPLMYLEPIGSYISNQGSANTIVNGARKNDPSNTAVDSTANFRYAVK